MSRREILSYGGYRSDGRRNKELRVFTCKIGEISDDFLADSSKNPDGFSSVEMGNTKVLAFVFGPQQSKKSKGNNIECEIIMSFFSMMNRRKHLKNDRQSQELSITIKKIFEQIIFLENVNHAFVNIRVYVLQNDGALQSAIINACSAALVDASIPMKDLIISSSSIFFKSTVLLDPSQIEINAGGPQLTIATQCHSDDVCLLELDSKLSKNDFQEMYSLCLQGCKEIAELLKAAIREQAVDMMSIQNI